MAISCPHPYPRATTSPSRGAEERDPDSFAPRPRRLLRFAIPFESCESKTRPTSSSHGSARSICGASTRPPSKPPTSLRPRAEGLRLELLESGCGRRSLSQPLGATVAARDDGAVEEHFDLEGLIGGRAVNLDEAIGWCRSSSRLDALLKSALGIRGREHLGPLDAVADDVLHERPRAGEAKGFIHGGDEGFGRVGEHVGLVALGSVLGAATECDARPEIDQTSPRRERFGVHERAAHSGELSLVGRRMRGDEKLAHAQAENRVAQELESLIVARAGLVGEARVRQRFFESRNCARADEARETSLQRAPRVRELVGVVHPAMTSVACAASRSSCVTPPASWVDHVTRTLPHFSSTSGWWSFFSARHPMRTTTPSPVAKSASL